MVAGWALLWWLCAFMDIPTISAFPPYRFIFFKNPAFLNILK